jgi:serine/threonine protein phosphatase 1
MKTIAFGDIHGCYKAAETAVKLAEELKAQAIFLGDYVDRGPSAVETLRVLMKAKENHPDWVFLRGNHDQMLLDLINGSAQTSEFGQILGMNYGYIQAEASYDEWQETFPDEKMAILAFLESTELHHETQKFIFCHAVLNNLGGALNEKSAPQFLWNYNYEPIWESKPFIHGHLPVNYPSLIYQGVNINTFCGYGGYLTGILIDETTDQFTFYSITENGVLMPASTIFSKYQIKDNIRLTLQIPKMDYSIELSLKDIDMKMTWADAKKFCSDLGAGWRLPSIADIEEVYEQFFKNGIGDFEETEYWTNNEDDNEDALYFDFRSGGGYSAENKNEKLAVRFIRVLQ